MKGENTKLKPMNCDWFACGDTWKSETEQVNWKSGSLEPVGEVGKGRGCERTRRTPSPYEPSFCELFFYFRGVHSHSCIMGNHGKMAGYWKIFIGIQSQLFLPEVIYLIVSLWKELLPSSRNNTLNLKLQRCPWSVFRKPIFCAILIL